MDATRIFLLALWTVFFVAALCMSVELIRHELGAKPRPLLPFAAVLLGVSGLILESVAA